LETGFLNDKNPVSKAETGLSKTMKRLLCVVLTASCAAGVTWRTAPAQPTANRLQSTNLKALNTAKDEDDPYLYVSRDGRTRRLFYASNASGRFNILMAEPNRRGEWTPGDAIEGLDSETDSRSPSLTLDGHDLYFATKIVVKDPDGGAKSAGNFDIVHSIRLSRVDQYTAPTPVLSVCTPADEAYPWVTADGHELYFSRRTADGWRLFVAGRKGRAGAFEEPKVIKELPADFYHATLTSDGRTMFLQGPLPNHRSGLYRCKRSRSGERWTAWSQPEALEPLNSLPEQAPRGDVSPSLSRDDLRLYFASDRRGGKGGLDLWVINAPSLISGVWKR
jgi:WD40-like Beta Propeller Repeat